MKYFKRIAVLLITGFLAFAPPGTLIFGMILILGLIGHIRFAVGAVFGLIVLVALLLVRSNINKRRCARSDINRRL